MVIWAIKNANQYFDEQLIQLFHDLSTFEGAHKYKSNQRTWEKGNWRFKVTDRSHYALDYRFVVSMYRAMRGREEYASSWDFLGNLGRSCHEQIADVIAVMGNLGFRTVGIPSTNRHWIAGKWQDFYADDDTLFQAKAHLNGNLHYRFMPEAMKALNIEAGRLLGWLASPADIFNELGYTLADAKRHYGSNAQLGTSCLKMLGYTA